MRSAPCIFARSFRPSLGWCCCIGYWDNGKEIGNFHNYVGLYWGYIRIMEKKMETTIIVGPISEARLGTCNAVEGRLVV